MTTLTDREMLIARLIFRKTVEAIVEMGKVVPVELIGLSLLSESDEELNERLAEKLLRLLDLRGTEWKPTPVVWGPHHFEVGKRLDLRCLKCGELASSIVHYMSAETEQSRADS